MKKLFSLIAMIIAMNIVSAQGYIPIRGTGMEARATQQGLVCIACSSSELNKVVDADLNNYANIGNLISAFGGNGLSVKNTIGSYPAGYITGFNVDLGDSPITVTLLNSIRIATYQNGILQESSTNSTLVSVPAFGGSKSRIFLHLQTTKSFDEIRLYQTTGVSIFSSMNVYYAFAFDPNNVPVENNGICDDIIGGNNLDTSVSSSGNFIAPLSYISNRERITDGDKNSSANIFMPAGLLGSFSVGVLDKNAVYPAGYRAGFVLSPSEQNTVFSAQVINNLSVETYLYGKLQETQTYNNGGGLINVTVLSFGSNKQRISINTTKPFNEVRLKVSQPLGVNIGNIKVFYAFEEPSTCDCKQYLQTNAPSPLTANIVNGTYGGGIFGWGGKPWTGVYNTIFSSLSNSGNVVDSNLNNASTFTVSPFSLGATANLTVQNNGTLFPAGTFAGFTIDRGATLFDIGILNSIRVSFYNGTTLTESQTGSSGLFSGRFITSASEKTVVGFKSTKPFNRIMITISNGISLNTFQTYNIYNAFIEGDSDNDGTPDCNDQCPGGDDSLDLNGNGIPDDCEESAFCYGDDKSSVFDTDDDGIVDFCDGDSDNDGIPDMWEDTNGDILFQNDDNEGVEGIVEIMGDGIGNFHDLDSDNDGVLDLHESGISLSIIDIIDTDRNGVIDSNINVGNNGIADILETSADSGILNYTLRDSDGDGTPDFLDTQSNGSDFDLHLIGRADLDEYGFGFITRGDDLDMDGIMDSIDNDVSERGSPYSDIPFSVNPLIAAKGEQLVEEFAIKLYPNPVKVGEDIYIEVSNDEILNYVIYSINGNILKKDILKDKSSIDTSSLLSGIYLIKFQSESISKTYKVIIK